MLLLKLVTLLLKYTSAFFELKIMIVKLLLPFSYLVWSQQMPFFIFFKQGTLRVLLVLLHDFPEFLCDYHYGFCDVIPPNCIQLRNLILSAFPRNMRLPDPFTPNLKVKFQTVQGKENDVLLIVLSLVSRGQANHLLGGPTAQNCRTDRPPFHAPISDCLDC